MRYVACVMCHMVFVVWHAACGVEYYVIESVRMFTDVTIVCLFILVL